LALGDLDDDGDGEASAPNVFKDEEETPLADADELDDDDTFIALLGVVDKEEDAFDDSLVAFAFLLTMAC
jgi:hypothetical protein